MGKDAAGAPSGRRRPCAMRQAGRKDPPVPGPAAGWGLPTCARCSIKLRPLPSRQFLCPRSQRAPPVTGEQPPQSPDWHRDPPGMTPMAFTTLLLVLALGAGTRAINITEITTTTNTTTTTTTTTDTTTTTTDTTTTDTTTTDTTTTDTTTTDTTTTDTTTTETTTTLATTAPNVTISKNTIGNGTQTPISSRATVVPTIGNSTSFQSGSSSTDKVTAKSTALPTSANITDNGNGWIPVSNTSTPRSSPVVPTFPTGASTGIPITSARGNGSSSAQVVPTQQTAVTAQGSTAAGQTPPAVPGSSSGPDPSKTAALLPTTVQLLVPIPLSFRILNRSFNESLRDPTSRDYRSLSYSVLTMFESVFGCTSCALRQSYKGCSELRFSPGSVRAQSTLVFGHGEGTVTSDTAEQQLRNSLNQDGFIRDLQLVDIQTGTVVVTSPAPVSAVPDWAIALLVLVSILLLLSILTCFLMTTCTCRRKSRGKLDLLSTKDSYNPMAEYPPYQSHGRYAPPTGKPNPYSQVAGSNGGGTGTFTYTNPSTGSDNL